MKLSSLSHCQLWGRSGDLCLQRKKRKRLCWRTQPGSGSAFAWVQRGLFAGRAAQTAPVCCPQLIEDLRKELEHLQLYKLECERPGRGRSSSSSLSEFNAKTREVEMEHEIKRLKQVSREKPLNPHQMYRNTLKNTSPSTLPSDFVLPFSH